MAGGRETWLELLRVAPLEAGAVTLPSTAPFLEGGSSGTEVPPGTLPPPTSPLPPYLTAAAGGGSNPASYPLGPLPSIMSGGPAHSRLTYGLPSFPPYSGGSGGTVGSTVFRPPSLSAAAGSSSLRLASPHSPYRSPLPSQWPQTADDQAPIPPFEWHHNLHGGMTAAAATAAAAAAARQYHDGDGFGAVDGARAFAGETDAEFAARLAASLVVDAPRPRTPSTPTTPSSRPSFGQAAPPPTRLPYSSPPLLPYSAAAARERAMSSPSTAPSCTATPSAPPLPSAPSPSISAAPVPEEGSCCVICLSAPPQVL